MLRVGDQRWETVWEVFSTAYDMTGEQRLAFLQSDTIDPELRREVLDLLEGSLSGIEDAAAVPLASAGREYPVGFAFGRYTIAALIGQGGFGRIYSAYDNDLRRLVALKILSGTLLSDQDSLIDEARAASALNHPNIVTVYETISADDHVAIAMEFVDGHSLRQILHQAAEPLPAGRVVRYGRQMAEALKAAHQMGITHRDVKPENILVRRDEYIKLVDFGLSTKVVMLPEESGARPFTGTLRYVAPEQLRGSAPSCASDIFALGLVLYEMAAGVHPFQGKTPLDTAEGIATAIPVPPARKAPHIPPDLDRLILAMLEKNPADRPTAPEVVRSLELIAAASERRWSRQAWLRGAAGLAAILALLVVLFQWTRNPRSLNMRFDTRPLTGEDGRETEPALSSDGRFVVYAWQEKARSQPVTIVREIGAGGKTVLPVPAPYAWLPDNQHIGFVHRGDPDTLCTIAKDGTGERPVLQAKGIFQFQWSPDGGAIVYVALLPDHKSLGLFMYSARTREIRQITFPPGTGTGDERFAISPNGKQVVFRRVLNYGNSDLFLIDLPVPGPPRQLTHSQSIGGSIAWTNDGSAIISSSFSDANYSLWLHSLNERQKPSRLTGVGIEASNVRSATRRNRLVWVSSVEDTNIWSVPVAGGNPVKWIGSAMRDLDVAVSSRGLTAFRSDRSGLPEIWIASKDRQIQKRVTSFETFTGSPRWSPDGLRLAFDSRRSNAAADIYVMDCDPAKIECGPPVQVTDHPAADSIPSWSADGTHIYFASERSGQWQVWKASANGSREPPVQMTTQGGFFATESPDGAWLYYSRIDSPQNMGVWRKPLGPSFSARNAGEMIVPLSFKATATWILSGHQIFYSVFGDATNLPAVWAFDTATKRKRLIHTTGDVPLARGLAVSPAGDAIFFSQLDRWQSNIIVADYEVVK
jgi:Tol biopolymer transport system component